MSYEINLYIGIKKRDKDNIVEIEGKTFYAYKDSNTEQWYYYTEIDEVKTVVPEDKVYKAQGIQQVAMLDLCAAGYNSLIHKMATNKTNDKLAFINKDNDVLQTRDNYDRHSTYEDIDDVLMAIRKDMARERYRRFIVAEALLHSIKEEFAEEIIVIFEGH